MSKITLYGFNNLTKSLSFSLYKLHYLDGNQAINNYNTYINETFSAAKLNAILVKICQTIGGNILNIAKQDYQPQGASVTLMISEEAQPLLYTETLVAHLDKSHLCIHTYPEDALPKSGIAIFRADIELSTCGVISPLKVLDYVIEEFNADIIDIDYRVRGMTRATNRKMLFNDNKINNISDHLSDKLQNKYIIKNYNLQSRNLFHTKLHKRQVSFKDYLFKGNQSNLPTDQQKKIKTQLEQELHLLFTNSI